MLEYLSTALGFLVLLPVVGSVAQWVAMRAVKVPVGSFTCYYGPKIARFPLGGTEVSIGCIPLGCNLAYDIPAFGAKPLAMRLGLIALGPATLLAFAACVLGPERALNHFLAGFLELPGGAFSPLSTAAGHIGSLQEVFRVSRLDTSAIIAAKLACYSCLPLGGMTTAAMIRNLSGRHAESEPMERFMLFSAVVGMMLAGSWAVALVAYAITNLA